MTHAHSTANVDARPGEHAAGLSVTVHGDLASVEALWRGFERRAVASCYQMYDFVAAWCRHCCAEAECTPLIVVGTDSAGEPALILPLGKFRSGPVTVASWLGDKHSNFNLGLYERSWAERLDGGAMREILAAVKRLAPELDAFDLSNQPESWMGVANPLCRLSWQVSPSPSFSTVLPSDFDRMMDERRGRKGRKRLRWQTRRLGEIGEIRMFKAQDPAGARLILEAFLEQRRARMLYQEIDNPFEDPGVRAMLGDLADATTGGDDDPLQLFALESGGRIVATYGGGHAYGRFSAAFNSYDMDETISRFSPGELLLQHVLRHCIERGLKAFDLGIGRADYKLAWCDTEDMLFDTLHPVSPLGSLYCMMRSTGLSAKRVIKNNPLLWSTAKLARKYARRTAGE